jgi:hypothetical protein
MSTAVLEQPQTGSTPRTADCTLFVPSCDAYSDLWTPFFALLDRYWADCPFPIVLGANKQEFSAQNVRVLHSGDEKNWSTQAIRQLSQLETPYILMMLDDFFLRAPVATESVLECLDFLHRRNGHCVRLLPRPAPPWASDLSDVGRIDPPDYVPIGKIPAATPYRVSTQGAIWRRETLLKLLREGESIWQFEMEGTQRSVAFPDGFYGARSHILTYEHHVVQRGKWFRDAAAHFGKMNIGCDFTRRAVMTPKEMLKWRMGKLRGEIAKRLPRSVRNALAGNQNTP